MFFTAFHSTSAVSRRAISGGAGLAALAAAAILLLAAAPARAQVVSFTAFDSGIGPGVTPVNSNAKVAQFDAAAAVLGSASLITFESAPVGAFTSLTIAPGGTLTFTFTAPVQAFGAYFTGVQPGFFQDTIGFDDVRLVPAPVPEVSTTLSSGLLLLLGLSGTVVAAKRKNKA